MPFLSPNQQCQSTEGKYNRINIMQLIELANTRCTDNNNNNNTKEAHIDFKVWP